MPNCLFLLFSTDSKSSWYKIENEHLSIHENLGNCFWNHFVLAHALLVKSNPEGEGLICENNKTQFRRKQLDHVLSL